MPPRRVKPGAEPYRPRHHRKGKEAADTSDTAQKRAQDDDVPGRSGERDRSDRRHLEPTASTAVGSKKPEDSTLDKHQTSGKFKSSGNNSSRTYSTQGQSKTSTASSHSTNKSYARRKKERNSGRANTEARAQKDISHSPTVVTSKWTVGARVGVPKTKGESTTGSAAFDGGLLKLPNGVVVDREEKNGAGKFGPRRLRDRFSGSGKSQPDPRNPAQNVQNPKLSSRHGHIPPEIDMRVEALQDPDYDRKSVTVLASETSTGKDPFNRDEPYGTSSKLQASQDWNRKMPKEIVEALQKEKSFEAALTNTPTMASFLGGLAHGKAYMSSSFDALLAASRTAELKDFFGKVWRNFCYRGITLFRASLKLTENDQLREATESAYAEFVQDMEASYQDFANTLHGRCPKDWIGSSTGKTTKEKLDLVNLHRTYIALGDLQRYLCLLEESKLSKADKVSLTCTKRFNTRALWEPCKDHYRKSIMICPKNGKSYNQMAIVALHSEIPLEAVYFYCRSLAVRQPILTARDGLIALYEKIQKRRLSSQAPKEERTPKVKAPEPPSAKESIQWQWQLPQGMRITDDSVNQAATSSETPETLPMSSKRRDPEKSSASVSDRDSLRRLFTVFLDVHAILFTKIGLDDVDFLQTELQCQLNNCLDQNLLSYQRLFQLALIGIFEVHNAKQSLSESTYKDSTKHSAQYTISVQMLLITCACMLDASIHTVGLLSKACDPERSRATILAATPALGLIFEWLAVQPSLWNQAPTEGMLNVLEKLCNFLTQLSINESYMEIDSYDIWSQLFNSDDDDDISDFDQESDDENELGFLLAGRALSSEEESDSDPGDSAEESNSGEDSLAAQGGLEAKSDETTDSNANSAIPEKTHLCIPGHIMRAIRQAGITLWEDVELRGFLYMEDAVQNRHRQLADTGENVNPSEVKAALRLARIVAFIQVAPVAKLVDFSQDDETDTIHFRVICNQGDTGQVGSTVDTVDGTGGAAALDSIESVDDETDSNFIPADDIRESATEDLEITSLSKRKADLENAKREKAADLKDRAAAAERVVKLQQIHSNTIRRVSPRYIFLDTNCFLDKFELVQKLSNSGLFKIQIPIMVVNELFSLQKASDEHKKGLDTAAAASISYLTDAFKNTQSVFSAVTGAGNTLRSIDFLSETETREEDDSNDDLILQSCVQYCHKNNGFVTDKNGDILAKVALLTGDVNLRIRAHAAGVPVRTIDEFCNWLYPT